MVEELLFSTNPQKILSFLIRHPDEEFFDRQVSKLTGISRAGTNFALRNLAKEGLILRQKRGRMYFYKAQSNDTLIKYLKITQNIAFLYPLVKKIKGLSLRITLYGSARNGENTPQSDIDLFILTRNTQKVKDIIFKSKLREKLQCIINTPNDFVKLKVKNKTFYKEIESGITLWEQNECRI